MSITNGYCTLAEIKTWAGLPAASTNDDPQLEVAVEAASRMIDQWCGRAFWDAASATVRYIHARHVEPDVIYTDPFSTATGLVVEHSEDDGSTWTTWASTDYQIEPLGGRTAGTSYYYDTIRAVGDYAFPADADAESVVRVTARWGWATVPTPVKLACQIQALRLFKRKDSPEGVLGWAADGATVRLPGVDPDVAAMLGPYKAVVVV